MNKEQIIVISPEMGIFRSLQYISEEILKLSKKDPITLDLSDISYHLSHEFFTVLKKRYSQYQITCIIPSQAQKKVFEGYGFTIQHQKMRSAFDKEFAKRHILRHNFTMWEYFLYEVRRFWEWLAFSLRRKEKPKYIPSTPSRSGSFLLILLGLITSISLLLFIFYFAVSKTIVIVEPQITVRPVSHNISFSTHPDTSVLAPQESMLSHQETLSIDHTMKFDVTSIDPNSVMNARGTITVFNELGVEQLMKLGTRFLTEDGIVYRSTATIRVPPARVANGVTTIGSTDITAVADPLDISGRMAGDRGNIADGVTMTIPGLKNNRDKIYGRSKGAFSGGKDPAVHVLTQEELDRSIGLLREQAKKMAIESLAKKITEENRLKNENLTLLMADTIRYPAEKIEVLDGLKVGSVTNTVSIKITLDITAIYYDKKQVVDYLSQVFRDTLLAGTDKELSVNPKLRISNVLSRSPDDSEVKVTMEMDATVTYDLENPANEMTRQMKILIAGLDRETAKTRILETKYVKDVVIKSSPFWMSRVANNMDNIEFVIKK